MTLQQINYVIKIAECGSFNRASDILYVSQPSLTQSIRELETELKIKIFNRTKRGVSLTPEGMDFLGYARELYSQFENLSERYGKTAKRKKKFSVSTQHYSFAVKAFVETVKAADASQYEFSIMETRTREVIADVASLRSEIGILFMSDFNRSALTKFIDGNELSFAPLIECKPYVYLRRGHPLADKKYIRFGDLAPYPRLAFEQGENGSLYYAEEMLSEKNTPQVIKTNDRATMLNLMIGLDGYTICSGIICEELTGDDYVAVPFRYEEGEEKQLLIVGYIKKKNVILSTTGELYVKKLREYLQDKIHQSKGVRYEK